MRRSSTTLVKSRLFLTLSIIVTLRSFISIYFQLYSQTGRKKLLFLVTLVSSNHNQQNIVARCLSLFVLFFFLRVLTGILVRAMGNSVMEWQHRWEYWRCDKWHNITQKSLSKIISSCYNFVFVLVWRVWLCVCVCV